MQYPFNENQDQLGQKQFESNFLHQICFPVKIIAMNSHSLTGQTIRPRSIVEGHIIHDTCIDYL